MNKKRSELLRLFVIVALLAMSVGVVLVYSAKVDSSSQQSNPIFVKGADNSSVNFTITVSSGSNTVRYVGVNRPASYSTINCPDSNPPSWTCNKASANLIAFTNNDGITAGNSAQFMLNATSGATSGNVSFTINTFENTAGTTAQNNTIMNVTVDDEAPTISIVNVTSGTFLVTNFSNNNTFLPKNALIINATVLSSIGPVAQGGVALYVNITNASSHVKFQPVLPHPTLAETFLHQVQMENTTVITTVAGRFNATIPSNLIENGSIVAFVIVANDTAGNLNVTNYSLSGYTESFMGFNVTIDDAAPQLSIAGFDDAFDAQPDNITTSNQTHNWSIFVDNSGGAAIHSVFMNVSGTLTEMASGGQNIYNISERSLWNLGLTQGDVNLTINFLANDSAGNLNDTFTLELLVDDPEVNFAVFSNVSNNFTTNNVTIINITFTLINGTINSTGAVANQSNVTIHGPNDLYFNMTRGGDAGGIRDNIGAANQSIHHSTWFSSIETLSNNGSTWSNLSSLGCTDISDDGGVCQLQIVWSDIFGRLNNTNISITIDNHPPNIYNSSLDGASDQNAVGVQTNRIVVVKSTDLLNITVNVENNVENVLVRNNSNKNSDLLANSTVMAAGGERNYSAEIRPGEFCVGEGECLITFYANDSALNFNQTNTTNITVIVDDTAPTVGRYGGIAANTAVSGFLMSNFSGLDTGDNILAANISGTNQSTFRGFTLVDGGVLVKGSAIFNLTVNVSDEFTNVTLVSAANSTFMNFTLGESSEQWHGVNSSNELCGLTGNIIETTCLLTFTAKDNVSNTNSTTTLLLRIDSEAPRVSNLTTNLSSAFTNDLSREINFSVDIIDANLGEFNVTLNGTSHVQMNRTDSSESNSTKVKYWVVTTLTTLGCSDGAACTISITANDSVNNVNDSINIQVTGDTSAPAVLSRTANAIFKTANPLIHANTSGPADCRYATNGPDNYSQMASQFDTQGTKNNSFVASNLRDKANYAYDISCVDLNGIAAADLVGNKQATFDVDTTSLWNITIGATGALSATADYFTLSNKFYKFELVNTNVLTTTSLNGGTFNVTNVLASITGTDGPVGDNNNLSILYAYNRTGDSWTSFVPGRTSGNDFTNFTSDVMDYYVNLSNANERLEIG
ncbi:hypothetical protein CMO88_01230 [Candidatus Woesearchaeota archaeon]|nr:hypothetical protein [Candidatus Woesearchaeota archaeon]